MKHKVGDTVRIKSREWWDAQPKNSCGSVKCGENFFTYNMTELCGQYAKIVGYSNSYDLNIDNSKYGWTDEMFEEDTMDAKTEALKAVQLAKEKLADAQKDVEEAEKLLEQVEEDPRIGKFCKLWDGDIEPPTETRRLAVVVDIVYTDYYPIKTYLDSAKHARLLTEEEKAKYL